MVKRKKKKNDSFYLCNYAVAYIDLLGQQEFLRNLSLPNPNNSEEVEKTRKQLLNTYGAVKRMRKFFIDSFEGYARHKSDLNGFTAQQIKEFLAHTNNPIKIQTFSDSVVIYMSLRTDTAKLPIRGIYGILGAAATTFTCSLAAGHPIRGGIDVGVGMDITKNEIYGPALSRAYTLESKLANYPRIIVGKELVRYLETVRDQPPIDITAKMAKPMAQKCLECLALDDDGYPFVDHLGEAYLQLFGDVVDATVVKMAYEKVIYFSEKYKKENNSKLAFRYTLLRNYFEHRIHLWEPLFNKKSEST